MNTAIFRDRADLILYADADADADPPLTGQQRPGGGGGPSKHDDTGPLPKGTVLVL